MSGELYQEPKKTKETNKLKNEVNKCELYFIFTGDPRPEPQVDKVGNKIRGETRKADIVVVKVRAF